MGTVNIAAFSQIESDIQAAYAPELLSENVTSSGTSAQSSAMPDKASIVRIATDTTVRINFGANPTATSAGIRLLADTMEYFTVLPGTKVAVINE